MRIVLSAQCIKSLKKHPKTIVARFSERRDLFLENQFHPLLNNHKLHGKYANHRSINIMGNFRAVYRHIEDDLVEFVVVDTHPNLYE